MFARFFVLLVCYGFFPQAVLAQAQARDCTTAGFKQLGTSNGESPLYPADPSCYPQISKSFIAYRVPQSTPWNEFAVVNSCVEFQDAQSTTTNTWFLQQVLNYELGNNRVFALKQFFGNLVYQANNALFYNDLSTKAKSLRGSKAIIPACKPIKDNQDAALTFWYNEKTHVLKVNFKVAVPYHNAYAVTETLSSLDKIKSGLMNVFNPKWLTTALNEAANHATSSCFVDAMKQLGKPGASVSCVSAGAGPTTQIKTQTKASVKVVGGGTGAVSTTQGGR